MQPSEIIAAITRSALPFPRAALESAIAQRAVIEPLLIQELDAFCDHPERYLEDDTFQLPFVSLYLFAQFRSAAAIPAVLRFLSLPGEHLELQLGDALVEDAGALFASIFHDHPSRLRELIDAPTAYEFVRGGALEAMNCLVDAGLVPKAEVRGILHDLIEGKLERKPSWTWESAQHLAAQLEFDEFRAAFEHLQSEGVVQSDSWEDLREGDVRSQGPPFIDDAISSLEMWLPSDEDYGGYDDYVTGSSETGEFTPPEPFVREAPKVGRNDPCPCGSGKKFKKCCG